MVPRVQSVLMKGAPTRKLSAGLLVYRRVAGRLEVLLAHPGGPFWKNKDQGAWSIVKGEIALGEEPLSAARREFTEETGLVADGPYLALGSVVQKAGKTVLGWACEADLDPDRIRSNRITIEFPPRSGRKLEIPEIDRAEYFDLAAAKIKINPGQLPFLARLDELVSEGARPG